MLWSFMRQVLRDERGFCQSAVVGVVRYCVASDITPFTSDTGDYCRVCDKLFLPALSHRHNRYNRHKSPALSDVNKSFITVDYLALPVKIDFSPIDETPIKRRILYRTNHKVGQRFASLLIINPATIFNTDLFLCTKLH